MKSKEHFTEEDTRRPHLRLRQLQFLDRFQLHLITIGTKIFMSLEEHLAKWLMDFWSEEISTYQKGRSFGIQMDLSAPFVRCLSMTKVARFSFPRSPLTEVGFFQIRRRSSNIETPDSTWGFFPVRKPQPITLLNFTNSKRDSTQTLPFREDLLIWQTDDA
jgi:hypothetical protein